MIISVYVRVRVRFFGEDLYGPGLFLAAANSRRCGNGVVSALREMRKRRTFRRRALVRSQSSFEVNEIVSLFAAMFLARKVWSFQPETSMKLERAYPVE